MTDLERATAAADAVAATATPTPVPAPPSREPHHAPAAPRAVHWAWVPLAVVVTAVVVLLVVPLAR